MIDDHAARYSQLPDEERRHQVLGELALALAEMHSMAVTIDAPLLAAAVDMAGRAAMAEKVIGTPGG